MTTPGRVNEKVQKILVLKLSTGVQHDANVHFKCGIFANGAVRVGRVKTAQAPFSDLDDLSVSSQAGAISSHQGDSPRHHHIRRVRTRKNRHAHHTT